MNKRNKFRWWPWILLGRWIFEARMKTVKRDERKISQIFLGHYQVFCRQLWRAIWQQENTLSEIDIGSSGLYLYGGKHTHATVYCHAPTYISWTLAYVVQSTPTSKSCELDRINITYALLTVLARLFVVGSLHCCRLSAFQDDRHDMVRAVWFILWPPLGEVGLVWEN